MEKKKKLLIGAVVLSLLVAFLAYRSMSDKGTVKTAGPGEGQPIIVAAVDIPARTQITAAMLTEKKVPPEYILPGAVRSKDTIVGMMSRDAVVSGEQITERRVLIEGKPGGGLAGFIPHNKRAVTLSIDDVKGVSGFIQPGDYVDVMASFTEQDIGDKGSRIFLQNVLVLAVNANPAGIQAPTGEKDKSGKAAPAAPGAGYSKNPTVTLAVSPEEAAMIALGEDYGKLRLALRPYRAEPAAFIAQAAVPTQLVPVAPRESSASKAAPAAAPAAPALPTVTEPLPGEGKSPSVNTYGVTIIRGTKIE